MKSTKVVDSLRDDFFRLETIEQGGFDEVYKVIEKKTGKIYVAKLNKIYDNSRYTSREIFILSKIKHKTIIKIKYFSKTDFNNYKNPVIFTEYMEKGSLYTIIDQARNSSPISGWNSTLKLINIYGIARAMSHLHLYHIIHKELRPDNIFLDNLLHPKVEFVGLSYQKSKPKDFEHYFAPEILTEYQYSEKSDVYSYGIIVHKIMTNFVPFEKRNIFQIMNYITNNNQLPLNKDIPASYENLIKRCLALEPQERPTFDEILYSLKNDKGFITNEVDENEYRNYVYYIDN